MKKKILLYIVQPKKVFIFYFYFFIFYFYFFIFLFLFFLFFFIFYFYFFIFYFLFFFCKKEKPTIFQIGTADPVLALQAANKVAKYVDGIDVNMCCPKPYSTLGGMGKSKIFYCFYFYFLSFYFFLFFIIFLLFFYFFFCFLGAELLKKVELSSDIIKTLKRNLPGHSVTCKMRLKETKQECLDYFKGFFRNKKIK